VEHHVERCQDCRRRVAAYRQVSETFHAYCDAVMTAEARRRVPRWMPVFAGTVVAAAVILLAFPRTRVEPPLVGPTINSASMPVPAPTPAEPASRKATTRRRHAVPRVQERAAEIQPMDTAIQIAIPAEAMFPPGAMPNGINFIADMTIAPDGSVQQVRLRQ
jgi:hypothetical protein